jgi:hypothetical protein
MTIAANQHVVPRYTFDVKFVITVKQTAHSRYYLTVKVSLAGTIVTGGQPQDARASTSAAGQYWGTISIEQPRS